MIRAQGMFLSGYKQDDAPKSKVLFNWWLDTRSLGVKTVPRNHRGEIMCGHVLQTQTGWEYSIFFFLILVSWKFCSLILFSRCHWVVLQWLLFSSLEVSFRFKEWSNLRSHPSFSPLRCSLHRWEQMVS